MSRSSLIVRAGAWAIASGTVCLLPATAAAQNAAVTPATGLFGVARANPHSTQRLSLTVRADENHDSEMLGSSSLQAGLRYERSRNERSLFVNADGGIHHYPGTAGITAVTSSLAAGFTAPLGRHTTVQVQQSARQSPFYGVELFDAVGGIETVAPASSGDLALFRQQTRAFMTSAMITRAVGRRSSIAVNYMLDRTDAGVMQFAAQSIGASFGYRLTRFATARAGYARRAAAYAGDAMLSSRPRIHDLDIGIDYTRPLSLTRKTTLTIGTGSSILPAGGRLHYRATGSASLARRFGRTWSAGIDYGRNVEFLDVMPDPLLSDGVGASIRGRINRRTDLSATARISKGSVGFSPDDDRRYSSGTGSLHLSVALNRFVAAYAEGTYFRHDFGQDAQLPPAFRHRAHRHDARIGVMVWAPLLD